MTALQRQEPGDPRAKAIEAMAARCASWTNQWRDPENGPFDGDESDYLYGMARAMLESGLAALEAEGWGLTCTREVERLREAIRAELTHGGIRDRIAQETAVLGAESEPGSPVRRAAERLDRDRDAFYERMAEALSSGPVEEEEKP